MNKQVIEPAPRKRSAYRIVFTLLLVVLSAQTIVVHYPYRVWLLGASLGAVAAITLFLRVGWTIPCMIGGVYAGLIADPPVKGGTPESQMWETVTAIVVGTVVGLLAGLAIDAMECNARKAP
jgi:hypothetical protein